MLLTLAYLNNDKKMNIIKPNRMEIKSWHQKFIILISVYRKGSNVLE